MNLSIRIRSTLLTVFVLLLGACASTPPSEFYMLSPVSVAGQERNAGAADLSIGRSTLRTALDRLRKDKLIVSR